MICALGRAGHTGSQLLLNLLARRLAGAVGELSERQLLDWLAALSELNAHSAQVLVLL